MKNKLAVYIVTLLSVFASGCQTDKEEETVLNVVKTQLDITENGGTGTIFVETNDAITAESDAEWCTVEVSGTEVNVSVTANSELTSRTATVTLFAGNKKTKVPVTQEGIKQKSRILTYEELLGEYTLTARLSEDWWYGTTTFTSTLHLEPLEEGKIYMATIENYIPDEAFFGYYEDEGSYEQYPLEIIYSNGNLVIPNNQLIAVDADEDLESPTAWIWVVFYFAVSSMGNIDHDEALTYVGRWNESLTNPVFTFSSGSSSRDFQIVGFVPYWWNIVPDDEQYDLADAGLFLYDWILTKKNAIIE